MLAITSEWQALQHVLDFRRALPEKRASLFDGIIACLAFWLSISAQTATPFQTSV
jgi:hypothetical protein